MSVVCLLIRLRRPYNYLNKFFFIILSVFISSLSAQVILPTAETAFEPAHHFNPAVIRDRAINKIVFEIIDKKDFEVAVDKKLTEIYEFNDKGQLTRFYFTVIARTLEKQVTRLNRKGQASVHTSSEYIYDTISTRYFYQNDQLVLQRYHDGINYYESRYYHYDAAGNKTKELRYRETNISPSKSFFLLGNQVLLSEDSFQYQKFSSGQLKCTFLNSENRPYKVQITNYDEAGRKKSISETYTSASWIMQEQRFVYDQGRLSAAEFEGNANSHVLLKNTFEYDENKELYTEKHFRNEVLEKETSYVTSKTDNLLNSIIIRDPVNLCIRIVRLKYERGQLGGK